VATFSLNHEQAEALAAQLATAIRQGSQNPAEVLPPYPIQEEAVQGVGVHRRRGRGRGQRGGMQPQPLQQPQPVITCQPVQVNISAADLHLARQARAQGFEENIGQQYVPFCITRLSGLDTPAYFIKVHMMDNLYVEAHMLPFTAVYCREIHAAPEVD
jgi:hypothetical protein